MNISLQDLSFTYPSGQRALDGVSLDIAAGEMLALVGENGAGKTTLVKQLNALLRPNAGSVTVGDWEVAERSTAQMARRVGFLFQNPDEQLFARSVWQEVAFGPRNLGLSEAQIDARVSGALDRVGLADHAQSHPYDLQHTDRKLVAMAATLAMDTPILVLDEPTIGQDANQRDMIGRIVDELHAEGRTLILISHDLDFCAEHAERVVVMADGRILADGPAAHVFSQPEALERAAVIAPQLVRLGQALGMPRPALTIPDFVEAYSAWKGGAE